MLKNILQVTIGAPTDLETNGKQVGRTDERKKSSTLRNKYYNNKYYWVKFFSNQKKTKNVDSIASKGTAAIKFLSFI